MNKGVIIFVETFYQTYTSESHFQTNMYVKAFLTNSPNFCTNKQWYLTSIYLLFQIYFLINSLSFFLSHLNIISSFILYSFFIIIYSSYIHSQQLYFSMKSVIFTIFFAILLQESHQNLMWKVVTSSNLNPLLKLFFYSPILAKYQSIT